MNDTIRVTEHSRFLICNAPGGQRFYADTPANRPVARDLDDKGDPIATTGFGVYDTNISTVYAVALYETKERAQAHQPSKTPAPVTDILSDEDEPDTGAEFNPDEETPTTYYNKGAKRRFKRT